MSRFPRLTSGLNAVMGLALLGLVMSPAQAETVHVTLNRSLTVPSGGQLVVENLAGQMTVSQATGSQVEITATVVAGGEDQAAAQALAQLIKLDVSNAGQHVTLHVNYPVDQYDHYNYTPARHGDEDALDNNCLFGVFCGNSNSSLEYQGTHVRVYQGNHKGTPLYVDITVKLPAGVSADLTNHVGYIKAADVKSDLALHSDQGDIEAQRISGRLDADTGSGDIGVADTEGALVLRTGSGDVKLTRVKGNASVHTGSGDISGGRLNGDTLETITGSGDIVLDDVTAALTLRTGSGDIHLGNISTHGALVAGTGSGDIELDGDLSRLTGFDLHAGSGDITLVTEHPPAVHLDISTGTGDITVRWPGVNNVASSEDSFSGDVGAAKGTGRIHSGSGDVTLKR